MPTASGRRRHWQTTDVDTGLNMLWRCDDQGHYTLQWSVPESARAGTYRLRVTATKYALTSAAFRIS